jgi:hypothetical protein
VGVVGVTTKALYLAAAVLALIRVGEWGIFYFAGGELIYNK